MAERRDGQVQFGREFAFRHLEQGFCPDLSHAVSIQLFQQISSLENWLLKTSDEKLSPTVQKVKRKLNKKAAAA